MIKQICSRRKEVLVLLLKLLVSAGLLSIIYIKTEFKMIFDKLKGINLPLLGLGYVLQNISIIISSLRSRLYLKEYGLNVSINDSVTLYYVGMFYNLLLPGGIGGDGYKIYVLWKKEKFSKLRSFRVFFYERLNGISALILIAGLLSLSGSVEEFGLLLKPILLISTLLVTPVYILSAHFIFRDKLKASFSIFPYSIVAQFFYLLSALASLYALEISDDFTIISNYLLVITISSVVAILPITIGGIGIRETTFLYAAKTLSIVDLNTGVSFAICNYVLYLAAGLTGGLFFCNLRKWKQKNGTAKNT